VALQQDQRQIERSVSLCACACLCFALPDGMWSEPTAAKVEVSPGQRQKKKKEGRQAERRGEGRETGGAF
jgi:hypothetical protein